MSTCTFSECGRPVFARRLCSGHYKQQREGKALSPIKQLARAASAYERFMLRARVDYATGCWEFGNADAYGAINDDSGRWGPVHRWAAQHLLGEDVTGRYVCHRCDNRKCANPSHLFVGSNQDNVRDMLAKNRGRFRMGRGELDGVARLTEDEVRLIRRSAEKTGAIAKVLGVNRRTVWRIRSGQSWTHVG